MTRRIVLLHANGLRQIVGRTDDPVPATVSEDAKVLVNDSPVALRLIRAEARYVLFVITE